MVATTTVPLLVYKTILVVLRTPQESIQVQSPQQLRLAVVLLVRPKLLCQAVRYTLVSVDQLQLQHQLLQLIPELLVCSLQEKHMVWDW